MEPEKEYCPCSKQTDNTILVQINGDAWWQCKHQGCERRVSGGWYYWRPGQGTRPEDAKRKGKSKSDAAEVEDSDDAEDTEEAEE